VIFKNIFENAMLDEEKQLAKCMSLTTVVSMAR